MKVQIDVYNRKNKVYFVFVVTFSNVPSREVKGLPSGPCTPYVDAPFGNLKKRAFSHK